MGQSRIIRPTLSEQEAPNQGQLRRPSFTQVYVGSDLQFGALLSISTITSHRVDMGNISEHSKIHFELLVKTLCTQVATVKTLVLLFLHAMLFVQPQRH